MATTIEYTQVQDYDDETAQQLTTYDECEWKTFEETEGEAAPLTGGGAGEEQF